MKSLTSVRKGRVRAPTRALVCALLALFAGCAASEARADGTNPPPSVPECLDRVTAGIYVNAYGARDVHSNTSYFPRYPLQVAQAICGQSLQHWRDTLACMDSMTAGVYVNAYGAVDVHTNTNYYPRYSTDQALQLCGRSQDNWKPAKQCLDGMTAGVYVNAYGAVDIHTNTTYYPRYPLSLALPVCSYAGNSDGQACMTNLLAVGVGESSANALCRANSSTQAQQCLTSFKLQGMGVLGAPDELSAARLCAQNPNAQPADFSQLQRCLSAGSTGQVTYAGATPPPVPAVPPATPGLGSTPGVGIASNVPTHN